MKTKILTYNNRDQVKQVYKELKPIKNHPYAFTFLENENSLGIRQVGFVLKVSDDIFITEGYYNEETILNHIDQDNRVKDTVKNYFSLWETVARPSLMMVEAYRLKGLDIEPLMQKRMDYDARKLKEKEEADKERAKQSEETMKKLKAEAIEIKNKLIAGETVSYAELIQSIDFHKFTVSPRTKGAILNQPGYMQIGIGMGRFSQGTANSTAQSIFKVVRKFTNS